MSHFEYERYEVVTKRERWNDLSIEPAIERREPGCTCSASSYVASVRR
jgi:hypothetical protein